VAEPAADRALNTTTPAPGETVRVTATVTVNSEGPVDYVDEFEPPFAEAVSLVSVTAGGTDVSTSFLAEYPDTLILSVSDVGPGEVTVTYDVTVPETAGPGTTHTFDGLAQTDSGETGVGGESQLVVAGDTPTFEVSLSEVPESVPVGEELTVEAGVTNTGAGPGTQQIGLDVDGQQRASTGVTLDPGESETVAFKYTPVSADVPELNVAVSSANETATAAVAVTEPAVFEVSLSEVPESATVGEKVVVETVVTNTGGAVGTQTVSLAVGGQQQASTAVTLDPGESGSVAFNYTLTPTDAPDQDLTVSTGNATATRTLTVTQQPFFDVELVSLPAAVAVDAQLSVAATVTNTGGTAETQPVTLAVDGEQVTAREVTLAGGANETVTFDYTPTAADTPELALAVSTVDATATGSVAVTDAAFFEVSVPSVPASATVGESVTVETLVTNVGDTAGTQSVTLAVDGEQVTDREVALAGGANETLAFDYTVAEADGPDLSVTAASEDDSAAATVPVLAPPLFDVTSLSVDGPVSPGTELSLTATVTNAGDVGATQSVTLAVGGTVQESTRVNLTGGASDTVTFTYTPTDPGERELTVATENTTAVERVRVLDPATFEVSLGTVEQASDGGSVTVAVTVENTGGVSGTQTVALSVDSNPVRNETLTLGSGERVTVTTNYTVAVDDPSTLDITAVTANDTASAALTVGTDDDTNSDDSTNDDSETSTDDTTDDEGDASGPGFGPGTLALAALGLGVLGRRLLTTDSARTQ
jgi:hypothetical protein